MQQIDHSDKRPRLLLADDHVMVTEVVGSLLEDEGYLVVGVVPDGRTLLAAAQNLRPDFVVLDIAMPLLNGLDAALQLRQVLPKVGIVFLTMKDDSNLAAAVLRLGPVGYVLKHSAASQLLTALREVSCGRSYVTPRLKPENCAESDTRSKQFSKSLTERQREVLQLLAEGRPMKEIGEVLNLSEKTVMFHKYQIMSRHDLKNDAELVLLALKERLIFT